MSRRDLTRAPNAAEDLQERCGSEPSHRRETRAISSHGPARSGAVPLPASPRFRARNLTKDSGRQLKLRWSTAVEPGPGWVTRANVIRSPAAGWRAGVAIFPTARRKMRVPDRFPRLPGASSCRERGGTPPTTRSTYADRSGSRDHEIPALTLIYPPKLLPPSHSDGSVRTALRNPRRRPPVTRKKPHV